MDRVYYRLHAKSEGVDVAVLENLVVYVTLLGRGGCKAHMDGTGGEFGFDDVV